MSVPRARLLELMRARCELFSTTFNPGGVRTGNKILRQRLKGSALASYYPPKIMNTSQFQKKFEHLQLEVEDEEEVDRLDHIAALKARGKSAPKKKRVADAPTPGKKKK
ncbi:mitochondrial ribosomal subunit S27-domain-containing protein [Chaetomium sp. MPI-SDFR-AT-0129]|nr:mitochondrial ribosomal subunit S27-domain-containing protein [Chaetomium sp. MPI-SDFR-AT-0129]